MPSPVGYDPAGWCSGDVRKNAIPSILVSCVVRRSGRVVALQPSCVLKTAAWAGTADAMRTP